MKQIDYTVMVDMAHISGLPGYAEGETVHVITDTPHSNLLMHDKSRQRMIILPYQQITSASFGNVASQTGSARAAAGYLVGGLSGAIIGAASADPSKNLVIIQYTSSAGENRSIVLSDSTGNKDVKDLVAVLQSKKPKATAGPTML